MSLYSTHRTCGEFSDCDDTTDAISPDADEICDSQDNDCDGDTDEADAIDQNTWFADADGDGLEP